MDHLTLMDTGAEYIVAAFVVGLLIRALNE